MNSLGRALVAVVVLTATSACQLTPNFETGYEVERASLRAQPPVGALAVKRFEDARPPRYYSSVARGFLLYIPLIPYVRMDYERIDESVRMQSADIEAGGPGMTRAEQRPAGDYENYTFPASFPRALANDLSQTGLFTACRYVGADAVGDERYLLEGTLRETPLHRTTTSYMLGVAGVLLWFLPVPMSKVSAEISVDVRIVDRETGKTVWTHTLHGDASRWITLYTSSAMVYGRGGAFSFNLEPPPSDARVNNRSLFSWQFESLRRAMLEARPGLAAALTEAESAGR